MLTQLEETCDMVTRIQQSRLALTDNFDIFELTLRRYHGQMEKMFPISAQETPDAYVSIITDAEARRLWIRHLGKTPFCSFDRFAEMMKSAFPELFSSSDRLVMLEYFVNYPQDDTVTTYKWSILVRLFGPFGSFARVFKKVALGLLRARFAVFAE
jgi:hypothetical protein